jgi:hypothetical protein
MKLLGVVTCSIGLLVLSVSLGGMAMATSVCHGTANGYYTGPPVVSCSGDCQPPPQTSCTPTSVTRNHPANTGSEVWGYPQPGPWTEYLEFCVCKDPNNPEDPGVTIWNGEKCQFILATYTGTSYPNWPDTNPAIANSTWHKLFCMKWECPSPCIVHDDLTPMLHYDYSCECPEGGE